MTPEDEAEFNRVVAKANTKIMAAIAALRQAEGHYVDRKWAPRARALRRIRDALDRQIEGSWD